MGADSPLETIRSWGTPIDGVAEVLHASFHSHAYPLHCHDTWTVLLIDEGCVHYQVAGRRRRAVHDRVTVLPPFVPHDGRAASPEHGFTKRVLYLEADVIGERLVGAAVDRSTLHDPPLRAAVSRLHRALVGSRDDLHAGQLLDGVVDRIHRWLGGGQPADPSRPVSEAAEAFRAYLDADLFSHHELSEVSAALGWSTGHLLRSFSTVFGLPPHRYLIGRRVDAARRQLLEGVAPAEVAVNVGFYDQAHLTRHFRRLLATTPARFQRSGARHRPS